MEESQTLAKSVAGVNLDALNMIRTHHERFDGTSYPRQLQGSAIPMLGRIAGIVDCNDAMISTGRMRLRAPHTRRCVS